jgi:hypothetical protein
MSIKKPCAYCGIPSDKRDREHVFPKNLYPESKSKTKTQRLTIPACNKCNNSWSDDEVHFRNVLVVAGDSPTPEKTELWSTTIDRSFAEIDGLKRLADLAKQLVAVKHDGVDRHKIFPGKDDRVVRVLKKIVRGLNYFHGINPPPTEEKIIVDILKYFIPEEFINIMEYHERDEDIVEYRYQLFEDEEFQSVWLITFFKTVTFIAIVSK